MTISQAEFLMMQARTGGSLSELHSQSADEEGPLHKYVIDYCRSKGWAFIHSRMDKKTTNGKGVPDFVIFKPGGSPICIECKAKGKKPTVEQIGFGRWLQRDGYKWFLAYNETEIEQAMKG